MALMTGSVAAGSAGRSASLPQILSIFCWRRHSCSDALRPNGSFHAAYAPAAASANNTIPYA